MSTKSNNSAANINNQAASGGSGSGTLRFTNEEKDILFTLFHNHEDVIDIKFRKSSKNKTSVRDAWAKIVDEYNTHPNIVTTRNLKQIQKFWLNARLRKQYPFKSFGSSIGASNKKQPKQEIQTSNLGNHTPMTISSPDNSVKHEPTEVQVVTSKPEDSIIESDYEEMIIPNSTTESMPDSPPTYATMQASQISVDQISADKLTLNDLLQFKKSRSRDDIIVQVKTNDGQQQQYHLPALQPSPMATTPTSYKHHQILHETHQPQIQVQQHTATHLPPASPTYCTYTVHNGATAMAQNVELLDDKLNYYRLKEAELRYKEEQISLEKKKIDLAKAQEEFKNMKELQRLQIEEMKIKIRLLHEQERQLKK